VSDAGPVAVVTGAGSGIGEASSRLLIEHGYRVVGVDWVLRENREEGARLSLSAGGRRRLTALACR
jgi:NAD(P)-dependent dehydrogenase (short-subunit alcohol dehydrogenase family)